MKAIVRSEVVRRLLLGRTVAKESSPGSDVSFWA
jgi:hypothetical protein